MSADWEDAYRAAVLETDRQELACKIDLATAALRDRWRELESSNEPEERQRINDAMRILDTIRRIELQIPA